VQGQVGNNLDLLPDAEWLRGNGTSQVPIRHGVPGMACKVPPGARVLLSFDGGDPRKPYASLWEGAAIEVSFAGGQQPIARVGDQVVVTVAGVVAGPAAVTATGVIMAGTPQVKA
jgi:hypothetical protein